MCDKAVDTYPSTINFFPDAIRLKKCVIEQLMNAFLYLILFLIDIKFKKYES